jgi:hypothetical protein
LFSTGHKRLQKEDEKLFDKGRFLTEGELLKLKREHGTVQVWGKDFKRDYTKEQLGENTGHSKSKERGFKE